MSRSHRKNREGGYALLLIFSMAAILAIMLYKEIPRVEFEAQRDKEQLLVDRGQEYSRAIALFVRKFNRFPASMEELENTNNMRFLRRRFKDPMTGKADWRLLHAGPGGVITDSILNGAKGASGGTGSVNNFITNLGPMTGEVPAGDPAGVNLAKRLRASDQPGAAGDDAGSGNGGGGTDSGSTSASLTNSGIPGYSGPVMVLPNGTIVPANSSGIAPQNGIPGAPGASGMGGMLGGMPIVPNGGTLPTGVAVQQNGQNGQSLPVVSPQQGGPPISAANMINQILTSPRPGGLNGLQNGPPGVNTAGGPLTAGGGITTAGTTSAPQQTVIGAGLAGVASKREQEGIKEYNTRKKYNEWEFVYDITKDPSKMGQGAGAAGATGAGGRGGASSQTPTGSPGGATPAAPITPGSTTGQ